MSKMKEPVPGANPETGETQHSNNREQFTDFVDPRKLKIGGINPRKATHPPLTPLAMEESL